MLQRLEYDIKNIITNLYKVGDEALNKLVLELPPEKIADSCDVSTNIALILAKTAQQNPMDIANIIAEKLRAVDYIAKCEVVKPAFINITLTNM